MPLLNPTTTQIYDVHKHLSHSFVNNPDGFRTPTPKMIFGTEMHEYLLNRDMTKFYDTEVINKCNQFYESFEKCMQKNFKTFVADYKCEKVVYASLFHSAKPNEDPLPFKGIVDMYSIERNVLYDLKITEKLTKNLTSHFGYDKQINTYLNLTGIDNGYIIFYELSTKKIIVSDRFNRIEDNEYFDGIYNKFYSNYYN